jgi:hypothetical protein
VEFLDGGKRWETHVVLADVPRAVRRVKGAKRWRGVTDPGFLARALGLALRTKLVADAGTLSPRQRQIAAAARRRAILLADMMRSSAMIVGPQEILRADLDALERAAFVTSRPIVLEGLRFRRGSVLGFRLYELAGKARGVLDSLRLADQAPKRDGETAPLVLDAVSTSLSKILVALAASSIGGS